MGHRDKFGLGPHFEHIERHIDLKTDELKDTLDANKKRSMYKHYESSSFA